ncbi:hypothetical protein B0J17DRAFT_67191 [Rhizoctonia solani]|nr:hypothetical protein B0J17DRAFT_67191 [Rhizoctonia solani]
MTIFNVMTGKRPFNNKKDPAVMMEVISGSRPHRSEFVTIPGSIDGSMENRLWNLIEHCWAHTPEDRPTAAEVSEILVEIERGTHESSSRSRVDILIRSLPRARNDILIAAIDVSLFAFLYLLSYLALWVIQPTAALQRWSHW